MSQTEIKNLSRNQLASLLETRGIQPYRAAQILRWIYLRQTDRFEDMTDLSRPIRSGLSDELISRRLEISRMEISMDGSRKFLFTLEDGNQIESVLIPEKEHHTLCISSQVGCAQGCRFCLTAQGGLIRNLSPHEIISQIRDIQNRMTDSDRITNIVVMGMGEPLANYENLIQALNIITDSEAGLGFSSRRVTVSTAGLVPRFSDLARNTSINIAVSLNASENKTRDRLMPINRKYPIETLLQACRDYPLRPRRRITFEYILIQGVNDSIEDACRLTRLLRGIKAKINLIPFNPHEGSEFNRPELPDILRFQKVLTDANYTAIIRFSKGQDISAACGQLRSGCLPVTQTV